MPKSCIIISLILLLFLGLLGCPEPPSTSPPQSPADDNRDLFPQLRSTSGFRVDKAFKDDFGQDVTDVQAGDEFRVHIIVQGYDQYFAQVIPFDAVLIIDTSGSMDGDKIENAKAAAISFVTRAGVEMASNPPIGGGSIRIGVVTFDKEARIVSLITDNYVQLVIDISMIDIENGCTDIAAGMELAQTMLYSSSSGVRIAILLTDGCPNPAESSPHPTPQAQEEYIHEVLLQDAIDAGIDYFCAGIMSPCSALLRLIAETMAGYYDELTNPDQIPQFFDDIFEFVAHYAIARQVVLEEQVNTNAVEIKPNSWQFSEGIVIPSSNQLSNFIQSGFISLNLGNMPTGRTRTFSFTVTTKNCLTPDAEEDFVPIYPNLSSKVTFYFGQVPSDFEVVQETINCHKPPGLVIKKEYDIDTEEVVISIENMYLMTSFVDNTIREVNIYEYLSEIFQYKKDSATTLQPTLIPGIYPTLIPGEYIDFLYWRIPEIAPEECLEIRFQLESRAFLPRDNYELPINYMPKGIETYSYCTYQLPSGEYEKSIINQDYIYAPMLENLPDGRPNLYLEPYFSHIEFIFPVIVWTLEEIPEVYIDELPDSWPWLDCPQFHWPRYSDHLFHIWESSDVWIDTEVNGFVSEWQPHRDASVIADIQEHIDYAEFEPMYGWFSEVRGQGDLWHLNSKNNICIRINNVGTDNSTGGSLDLKVFSYSIYDWEIVETIQLPTIEPDSSKIITVKLPRDVLQPEHLLELEPFYGDIDIWTAMVMAQLNTANNEKYTNNNVTVEKFVVVP
ncbi:MAG: VWA domain-containing protein [Desulfobacteraceae bacterium]|nr:VWA domain-containing protein [Desulfobacteraceae bacterium]